MSATYSDDLSIGLNRARFLLGDTDVSEALIEDEAITAMLGLYEFNEAVAQLATGLATRFAQEASSEDQDGGLKQIWADRVATWLQLAKDLRTVTQTANPSVPRSGISVGRIRHPHTDRLRF